MALLPAVGPSPLSVNPVFEIGPLEPVSVWKSTSELEYPENYCRDLREPPRHRADAVAGTTSR